MLLSEKQAKFMKDEFGIDIIPNVETDIPEDEWEKLMDDCLMIECDESKSEHFSERGRIAVSLLDMPY